LHRKWQLYGKTGARHSSDCFHTKVYNGLFRPLLAAERPAPLHVRQALAALDHAVTDYIGHARVAA
jgi:hypothetical protein